MQTKSLYRNAETEIHKDEGGIFRGHRLCKGLVGNVLTDIIKR